MKTLSENRRARFDYEIAETLEAGIELLGHEVKSVKLGRMQIAGSYAVLRNHELYLLNAEIPAYQPKNTPADYDSKRSRRLLVHSAELKRLAGRLREKGASLVPLRAYMKKNLIKLELGLGRSKKKADKRETLKKRAALREIQRFE